MPDCCWLTRRAATTTRSPAAYPICSIIIRSGASSLRAPIASRFCSTTRLSILLPSMKPSTPGWNASAANASLSDVPFFLEFVGYEENVDEKGIEYARKKPEIVARSMEEFSKPQYAVDVLKVEVPVNMAFVKGARSSKGESVYTREEAKEHFRRAASMAKKPFIYLSAGVSNDTFNESLELAAEAGTNFSGVLCGRATWKDGIPVYAKQGLKAFEEWLSKQGVANINNVNQRLAAAKPWFSFYGAASVTALS